LWESKGIAGTDYFHSQLKVQNESFLCNGSMHENVPVLLLLLLLLSPPPAPAEWI
jgi:hypothetical protein